MIKHLALDNHTTIIIRDSFFEEVLADALDFTCLCTFICSTVFLNVGLHLATY